MIPRYAVPGLVRTKAIYMSDMIAKLAGEFSKEKNVTQREIMEAVFNTGGRFFCVVTNVVFLQGNNSKEPSPCVKYSKEPSPCVNYYFCCINSTKGAVFRYIKKPQTRMKSRVQSLS